MSKRNSRFTGTVRVEATLACDVPFGKEQDALLARNTALAADTARRVFQILVGPIPKCVRYETIKTEVISLEAS